MNRTLPALILLAVMLLIPFTSTQAQNWHVELATPWTALQQNNSGWTGADGIWSVPLNGDERPGAYQYTNTFVIYSDTIIGEVDSSGIRQSEGIARNTFCFLPPGPPSLETATFYYERDNQNNLRGVFMPTTQHAQPGEYYWPGDGIALGNYLYFTVNRMYDDNNWFYRAGISMLRIPLDTRPPFDDDVQQVEVPLWAPATADRGELSFTSGFFPNTVRAGAPFPDGYIYVYGLEEIPFNKYLLVARVPEDQFLNMQAWRFWAGPDQGWVPEMEASVTVTDRVSSELSVSPLADGRYILVFQLDTLGDYVAVRLAPTPVGPWGDFHQIYYCPQTDSLNGDVYPYNAKAHPHLSDEGELLISYNVGGGNFFQYFTYADIYRPRFIRLILDDGILNNPGAERGSVVTLNPAPLIAPNPFNAMATVNLTLPQASNVSVAVYDVMGRLVEQLHDGYLPAGEQTLSLDAGQFASGTYFLRVDGADALPPRKFTVVK